MLAVRITDRAALASLDPEAVAAYLRDAGWELAATKPSGAQRWKIKVANTRWAEFREAIGWDGTVWTLLGPRHFDDYALCLSHLIDRVSLVEDRSQLDVFLDMGGSLGLREPRRSR